MLDSRWLDWVFLQTSPEIRGTIMSSMVQMHREGRPREQLFDNLLSSQIRIRITLVTDLLIQMRRDLDPASLEKIVQPANAIPSVSIGLQEDLMASICCRLTVILC